MWAPNPVTFAEISLLNPVIMATATIITVSPSAIPKVAMANDGAGKAFASLLFADDPACDKQFGIQTDSGLWLQM